MGLEEEKVPPCKICKKVWRRKDYEKWVYYGGTLACLSHKGVEEWYNEKLRLGGWDTIK